MIREDIKLAELSKKFGVHATHISTRKRAAMESIASAFGRRGHNPDKPSTAGVENLQFMAIIDKQF